MLDNVVKCGIMQGYCSLSSENRRKLLLTLAKEYDLNRAQVRELIKQYLGLQSPGDELTVLLFNFFWILVFVVSGIEWCRVLLFQGVKLNQEELKMKAFFQLSIA